MRTLESLGDVQSRTVIVRSDLNVPLHDGAVGDDGRIRASLPTIQYLSEQGARVIVISHLGRPKDSSDVQFSLAPVAQRMSELLGKEVQFVSETVGMRAETARAALVDGEVLILENLRFNQGETSKNADERLEFAKQLAGGADAFVSDGFGVVHRAQASVTELATVLPSAAGNLVLAETRVLQRLIDNPERPALVILGGSKVSDKLGVISRLIEHVDTILIGGGMMFTFLAAQGHPVGKSLLERDQIETVRGYLSRAAELKVNIVLPLDAVVAKAFDESAEHETLPVEALTAGKFGADGIGLDIGPKTAELFAREIASAKSVFWNGPMGVFEMPPFADGTRVIARSLSESHAFTVVGGGDSAAAVRSLGFADEDFDHVSTGGGASLELLEGQALPGLEVLK